jgi:hypothetical protein
MPLQITTPTAKPKKHHKIEQHIATYSEVAEENGIKPVIPPKKKRIIQRIYDKEI